jgi:hypothetical protein
MTVSVVVSMGVAMAGRAIIAVVIAVIVGSGGGHDQCYIIT